jgi:hypothetical protein
MVPQLHSHPWVYSATKTDGKISLRVEVTDLRTTQGFIEITGQATQVNGAFAPISCIKNITEAFEGDPKDDDQKGRLFMDVEATPTSDHDFMDNEDVTVFVRVSKVWVTVVGPGTEDPVGPIVSGEEPNDPPTWGKPKADAHISAQEGNY